jgi:hypothetical protein
LYLGAVLSWTIAKKIHWSVGLTFAFLVFSGITGFYFPKNYAVSASVQLVMQLNQIISRGGSEVLYATIMLLLFGILLIIQDKKFFMNAIKILFFGAVLNSFVIIVKFFVWHKDYAIFSSDAADASFIGCMLPCIFIFKKRWKEFLCGIVMVLAIVLTKSSTGLGTIGIAVAFIALQELKFKKWIYWMVPITLGICAFGHFFIGHELLNDNDRLPIFKTIFSFYKTYANPFIGAGTGSFTVWGDVAQRVAHDGSPNYFNIFIWLHDEPLEILFENGIIGLGLVLAVYILALAKTFRRKEMIFSMLCIYGFTSLTEQPLRFWVTQLLGVCLLRLAFDQSKKEYI